MRLNLTAKIDESNTINKQIFQNLIVLRFPLELLFTFGVCISNTTNKKKFKAISSTKSQLHQPPQDNSCSAQQQPSISAEYEL